MNSPLIDQYLPEKYLLDLGRYVQTCAHIEHSVCLVICQIEGQDLNHNAGKERHDDLRLLSTKDLIKQFSQTTRKFESDAWEPYFSELTAWFYRTIDTRHLAIHGRHYFEDHTLKVQAPLRKGRAQRIQTVSSNDIEGALKSADDVLKAIQRYLAENPQNLS